MKRLWIVAALSACTAEPAPPPTPIDEVAEPAIAVAPETEQEPEGTAFVTGTSAMYRTASKDKRVEVDGEKVSNYLSTLYRGESVSVLERDGQYTRVQISDGTTGYLRESAVLRNAEIATVVAETKTFRRPSLVNLGKRVVAAGTPLFVLSTKGEFAEVNFTGRSTTWVLQDNLVRARDAITLSRILDRARALAAAKDKDRSEEIEGLVALGTSQHPDSPLLPELVRVVDPERADALAEALADKKPEVQRVSFNLHGSTPTLAWSPDSKSLLVNAAYEYFGHEESIARYKEKLGVFRVDASTGAGSPVYRGVAHHPIWLGSDQIAWGSSTYEADDDAGLYVASVSGGKPRRVAGGDKGVHHTAPGVSGGALFVEVDWDEPEQWRRYDPREGTVFTLEPANDTWVPPAKHLDSQCKSALNGRTVIADESGVRVQDGEGGEVRLSDEAPYRYEVGDWVCGNPDDDVVGKECGYTSGCFSPDGKRVAVIHGKVDALRLVIYQL
ncbi:MAG: hypothetical protein AAF654_14540 [Myxococcota bacterium]